MTDSLKERIEKDADEHLKELGSISCDSSKYSYIAGATKYANELLSEVERLTKACDYWQDKFQKASEHGDKEFTEYAKLFAENERLKVENDIKRKHESKQQAKI